MRIPVIPLLVLTLICVATDAYIYVAALKRCSSKVPSRVQLWSAIALYVGLVVTLCLPRRSGSDATLHTIMWALFSFLSIYCSKLIFIIFDLLAKLPQIFCFHRLKWLSLTGGCLSVVTFLAVWWGALINRFNIQVNEVDIEVPDLPLGFKGYKIAQFSDLHTGTFGSDTTFVSHLVDKINSLNPDLITFTGDIVNRHTDEILPHISTLSRLEAPDGVVSILGNHDYGDYSDWDSPEEKRANLQKLIDIQNQIGWNLLLNESIVLYNNGDSIAVIGVENVGDPPFTVYGSLRDSYKNVNDSVAKILLTHNPAHWSQEIADRTDNNIALTLSGHTHAMQIEFFGISPAVFRYKTWGGLYKDSKGSHPLYVNIGSGTVGLPMRVGATPEITVFTLHRAK